MSSLGEAERWRAHAADALAAASRMTDSEARRAVCQIAIGYWLLAQRADRRETTGRPEPLPKSSYGPDCLTVICRAFGDAWNVISAQIGDDPRDVEPARNELAHVMLSLADEDISDATALKDAALQAIALRYGSLEA